MNKSIMDSWYHIDIYPNIILAEHETAEHEKTVWVWDNYSSLFDRDTLICIDLRDNKIIYMHSCLTASLDIVIDEIREMDYVNEKLLSELIKND